MKIWVDDIRTPPDDTWYWFKDSESTIEFLDTARIMCDRGNPYWIVDTMSLDHDLGGDDTSRRIVLWCCENDFWPVEVRVHTANPVGYFWLISMIERYKT